jgi:predicted Zn-dependent peptidase
MDRSGGPVTGTATETVAGGRGATGETAGTAGIGLLSRPRRRVAAPNRTGLKARKKRPLRSAALRPLRAGDRLRAPMAYERTQLDSGIRILTEAMPAVRSVALGVWVGAGSRHEPERVAGATHFLEHMLFKGTATRSAEEIAESFDAVGGDVNAFTTREFTCFYARLLQEDLSMAVEILADMLQASMLRDDDVEAERRVVLEEIAMHEDAPDDIVHDLFIETIWAGHPLARRVQGYEGTVAAMPRDAIESWYREQYVPPNLVVAAAGSVDHQTLVDAVEKAFRGVKASAPKRMPWMEPPDVHAGITSRARDIEQVHLVWGTAGMSRRDQRRWALGVLNFAVGGGMSSRLFQEIREKRGMAYSVWSSHQSFADTGLYTMYAATAPERSREVLDIARDQLAAVADEGITEEEMLRGKGHLRGNLVLSLEETPGRMTRLGKSDLCEDEILSPDEAIARIERVTLDDVKQVARDVLGTGDWALAAVGPDDGLELQGFAGPLRS